MAAHVVTTTGRGKQWPITFGSMQRKKIALQPSLSRADLATLLQTKNQRKAINVNTDYSGLEQILGQKKIPQNNYKSIHHVFMSD